MPDLKLSLIITTDGKAAVTGIRQIRQEAEGVGTSAHAGATQAGAAFDGLWSKVGALGRNLSALLGIGFGAAMVKEAVMSGDAYNTLQARIQDATRAKGNYAATSQAVLEISQRTGAQLSTSVSLYQSLARSAGELGAKQADVLKLQETVQKLGVIGGAATANMNAGLLQFGQMLAGGVAHAEEMNSLLENIPAVAEAIAKGMGMTTGQLRAAVLEGKVLSQDVMRAILSQSGDVEARFKSMPASIERATTELDNAWSLFMGNLTKSSGLAQGLADIIHGTAQTLTEWGKELDPTKVKIQEIGTEISRLQGQINESSGQGLLFKWLHGSTDEMEKRIASLSQDLADLQGLTSHLGADPGMVQSWIDADQTLDEMIQTEKEMNAWFDAINGTAVNSATAAKSAWNEAALSMALDLEKVGQKIRSELEFGSKQTGASFYLEKELTLRTQIIELIAKGKVEEASALSASSVAYLSRAQAIGVDIDRLRGKEAAEEAAKKATSEHNKAMREAERDAKAEAREMESLSRSLRSIYEEIDPAVRETNALGDAQEILNQAMAAGILTQEEVTDTMKRLTYARSQEKKALDDEMEGYGRAQESADNLIASMEQEIALYGLKGRELAITTALARTDVGVTAEQAEKIRELAGRLYDMEEASRVAAEASQPFKEAWNGALQSVDGAFERLFESGFRNFKEFAASLKQSFLKLIADLVYAAAKQQIVIALGMGSAGAAGTANAATGTQGLVGDAMNAISLVNAGNTLSASGGMYTGISNAVASIASGAVVSGFTTGIGIALENIGAAGYFGAMSATMSAAGSAAASGAIGTATGMAIPYVGWVIAAVAALAAIFGGQGDTTPDLTLRQGAYRMNPDLGTQFEDTGSDRNNLAGYIQDAFGGFFFGTQHADLDAQTKQKIAEAMKAYGASFDLIATLLSDNMVDAASQAVADLEKIKVEHPSKWDDAMAEFFKARMDAVFQAVGGELQGLYDTFVADVDFANAGQVLQLATSIAAVTNATGPLKETLTALIDPTRTNAAAIAELAQKDEIYAATLVRLGVEIAGVNEILDALGAQMLPLNEIGAAAADALIQLAGGMENLTNASRYFYEHFYTEEERRARIIEQGQAAAAAFSDQYKDLIAASGAAADGVIDTGAELRAFVESLDLTTEAGRAAYLAAMALAPSIVAITDAMNAAGAAADNATQSMMQSGGPGSGFGFQQPGSSPPPPGTSGGGLQSGSGFGFQQPGDTTPQAPIGGETPGSSVPDIGTWQPWHDAGSASGGGGSGGGSLPDFSAQLADFMAGIQAGLDKLQLSDFDYSLKALGLEFDALRAKAEALGASAEDMALIDELEGLRESELRAAEAARLAADAARAAAGDLERVGALGSAMNDVQDQLAKLQLSDTDYALRELSINMAALRAQIIALGGSAEDLALVDQLEALRLAQIEAAAAAEAARQAEEAQAEAERQAREQAEAAYEALATAEKQAQQELDALADAMEEFNRAVQSVRDDIAGSVLSILRDQPGWSEADYQRQRITQLRQRIDQASGLEQIALIGELQEAILARYQAERAELEATATQQTDLYSAMEQAHQAELQHYQDVTVALRDLAKYVDSLKLDDRLSTLTPFQKLEEAQRQFYATLGLAQGGDAQAIRDLSGAASAYLQDARAYFASGEQYTAIFDAVTQALEALTGQNVAAPMGEDEWRDFMASLQSTQTDAVVDLSGIQDQALTELQALDELLTILTGEQALAAQEQQAAILETLQESRDAFASFAGEMPEDLAQAADDIGAATDNAAERITSAITSAIQSMDQHLADTNAQVSANTQAIAGLQAQLAALAAQNAALAAQNAQLQAQLDSNTANLA